MYHTISQENHIKQYERHCWFGLEHSARVGKIIKEGYKPLVPIILFSKSVIKIIKNSNCCPIVIYHEIRISSTENHLFFQLYSSLPLWQAR